MRNFLFALLLFVLAPQIAQCAPLAPVGTAIVEIAPEPIDLNITDAKRARDIPIRVYLPANKAAAGQTAATPVVLFSHGLGGTRQAATYLGKYWAAHGYAAVFLQHAGSDGEVWKNLPPRQRMAAMKKAGNLDNFLLRVGDVAAVLDQLEIWNNQTDNPLAGRLDMSRVGMAGHSFGAVTTEAVSGQTSAIGVGFTDKRIKAALILSPSAPEKGDAKTAFGNVKIPWLLMTGTLDKSEIRGTGADSRLKVFPALPADGQKYQLILDKAEHSAFVDARMARDTVARNPNHHHAIETISTTFWDAYLKGDATAKTWLDGDGVREVLEAVDAWQTK